MGCNSALLLTVVGVLAPPERGAIEHRVMLLSELSAVTELECAGHDELIAQFDRALESVDEDGSHAAVRLQIGRLNALLLQRVQTGDGESVSAISAAALRLHGAATASDDPELADELQTLASDVASALDGDTPELCAESEQARAPVAAPPPPTPTDAFREPVGPTLPPDSGGPAHEPPKRWTSAELGLVGGGAALAVGGLASVLTGVIGPIAARSHPKIEEDDEGQQTFLDETVPRNATIAFAVGGAALTIGVGLIVTGLVIRRRRGGPSRTSDPRPRGGSRSAGRGDHSGKRAGPTTATSAWMPVFVR